MNIKNAVREWLGINSDVERIEESIELLRRSLEKKAMMRLIGEAMEAALSGESDSEWWPVMPRGSNRVEAALKRAADDAVDDVAHRTVKGYVADEAFIDGIVARIKRKQLSGNAQQGE